MARFAAFVPIPKEKTGQHRAAPRTVLVPRSALGSCRHGALSSAQAIIHRSAIRRHWQSPCRRGQTAARLASRAALLLSLAASSLQSLSVWAETGTQLVLDSSYVPVSA